MKHLQLLRRLNQHKHPSKSAISRRNILQLMMAGLLATPFASKNLLAAAPTTQNISLGFHLATWEEDRVNDTRAWQNAIKDLHKIGIKRVVIVMYRFADPITGKISSSSQFGLEKGPNKKVIKAALKAARNLDMEISLYPIVEIDDRAGLGEKWRGNLNFQDASLKKFFTGYSRYILETAETAVKHGSKRVYLGSELYQLTHNINAILYWRALIEDLYEAHGDKGIRMIYAAHHDEFQTFPFWDNLDEIGINAYFPVMEPEETDGTNLPTRAALKSNWQIKLSELKLFAKKNRKPIIFSEWGVVPFDGTTNEPWNDQPSYINDHAEQYNAYAAFLSTISNQQDWLKGIDFWHWQLRGISGSTYGIDNESKIANLITDYAKK